MCSRHNSYNRLIRLDLSTIILFKGHSVYSTENELLSFKEHMINFVVHRNSLFSITSVHSHLLLKYLQTILPLSCLSARFSRPREFLFIEFNPKFIHLFLPFPLGFDFDLERRSKIIENIFTFFSLRCSSTRVRSNLYL